MKKLLATLLCLSFLFSFASADELFTDEVVENIKSSSIPDLVDGFVIGMTGISKEEFVSTSNAKDLENVCIVLDRIADVCEYTKSYFAGELKKKDEVAAAAFANADINITALDLSQLSYQELTELKDHIDLAIWNSQEWQEVAVPQGVWKVGEDIPAGHWTIKAAGSFTSIETGTALNDMGKNIDVWKSDGYFVKHIYSPSYFAFDANQHMQKIDLELENGIYVVVDNGSAVFTPYAGKPSLAFK